MQTRFAAPAANLVLPVHYHRFIQQIFAGSVEASCYFTLANGKASPSAGVCENPTLTIETPFDVWMDVMTGKADGAKMLMEQKYKVTGDMALMMNLFRK